MELHTHPVRIGQVPRRVEAASRQQRGLDVACKKKKAAYRLVLSVRVFIDANQTSRRDTCSIGKFLFLAASPRAVAGAPVRALAIPREIAALRILSGFPKPREPFHREPNSTTALPAIRQ